ncbi:V-type ATP synthase subunit D [Rubripirellula obstinata]|uniref:V-type ATP synthase subunit D n=1 Tax=Rubripirellula obstinata TaxID=406547 RepID=A0A5B1CQ55_9BACT|nr:V-type ATP synthase subunit D [Rubripirellula obstinata]KAA1261989.1 V-type ATP synthase subunit D [Rubripirellula obstinata]
MTLALNKTTLKRQRDQAKLYRKFLPSLELKRQQLQAAWRKSQTELAALEAEVERVKADLETLYPLIGGSTIDVAEMKHWVRIVELTHETENVVGTSVPVLGELRLEVQPYSRLIMPFWVDSLVAALQQMVRLRVQVQVARQRTEVLAAALRRVTQRVNLFDKVLIPQAEDNIRRIVIFLSDQERAAVVRSKIAKSR